MARNRLEWFAFDVDAYDEKTSDLDLEQHGAYLQLLKLAWKRKGSLPNDMDGLKRALAAFVARLHGNKFNSIVVPILTRFFYQAEDGSWRNKRMDEELESAFAGSRSGAENAEKRWRSHREKVEIASRSLGESSEKPDTADNNINNLANATALPTQCDIQGHIQLQDLSNDKSLAPAPPDADGKPKRQRKKKDSETPAILARLLKPETVEKLIRQRRRKGVTLSEDWAESLVERLRQYGTDPGEWEWAAKAIIDNDWQGFQPGWMRNIPRPESGPQPAQIDWEARVSYFAQKSQWPFRDSPAPGSPGCLAPAALLEKFNLPPTPAAAPMPRARLQLIQSA